MEEKKELFIKVSHPDPEEQAKGVEAVKGFLKSLSKLTGEEIEMKEVEIKD